MPLCGGIGAVKPADSTISEVFDKVKGEILGKLGKVVAEAEDFPKVHSYKTQVVAGTNFFAKVEVAAKEFVHVRIYRDIQGNVTLHGVTDPKEEADEIEYF